MHMSHSKVTSLCTMCLHKHRHTSSEHRISVVILYVECATGDGAMEGLVLTSPWQLCVPLCRFLE